MPTINAAVVVALEIDARVKLRTVSFKDTHARWDLTNLPVKYAAVLVDNTQQDVVVSARTIGVVNASVSVDLWFGADVVVVADIPFEIVLVQHNTHMGTTFMDEFMGLVNGLRASLGRTPYLTYGSDVLSRKKLALADIAQQHSHNQEDARVYAHESGSFPIGWQTFSQRLEFVSDNGLENIQARSTYTYGFGGGVYTTPTPEQVYIAWRDSPGHYANMVYDWGARTNIYSNLGYANGEQDPLVYATDGVIQLAYITNNFLVLEEVVVEITFEQHWEFNGAVISVLDQAWTNYAYVNVKTSHNAPFSINLGVAHEAQYGVRVAAQHEAPIYFSTGTSFESPYSASLPIGGKSHIAPYAIKLEVVAQSHDAPYAAGVRASMESQYIAAIKVQAASSSPYEPLVKVGQQHIAPSVMPEPVRASNEAGYSLSLRNPARAAQESRWALATEGGLVADDPVTLLFSGKTIRLSDCYLSSGKNDVGYRFEGVIDDLEFHASLVEGSTIIVDFSGEEYQFVVISRSINRSGPAQNSASVSAVSPVYLQDQPYSSVIDYQPLVVKLMSLIIAEVMASAITWEIEDWLVPVGRVNVSSATPVAAATTLLASVGAGLQSNPDGTLVVRYLYPTNWDVVQSIAVAHTFDDATELLNLSSSYEYRPGYNKFHLKDSETGFGDTVSWEPDKDNYLTGIAKVTPYPYRSSWTLTTTSESPLNIEDLGDVIDELEEIVEFVGGVGSVQRPIMALGVVQWLSVSLGGISFDPYSTKLTTATGVNAGYGLAKIAYQSKSHKFRVSSLTALEAAQLLVTEA